MPESQFQYSCQQLVTNIPDTRVCNSLDSHFYHYTKRRWPTETTSTSNKKKHFRKHRNSTNIWLHQKTYLAFRFSKITCRWLLLLANTPVLREGMCHRHSAWALLCPPAWEYHAVTWVLRGGGRINIYRQNHDYGCTKHIAYKTKFHNKKKIPVFNDFKSAERQPYWKYDRTGAREIKKKKSLWGTQKFQTPKGWYEVSSVLGSHKRTKFSGHFHLAPGKWSPQRQILNVAPTTAVLWW